MGNTVGSLFSGCGGLDLGFELAGFETAWFAETDKWCNKILEKQWPEVPRYGDVRELENLEPIDVLVGGFPCQPVSQAGKKLAEEDPRWLWPGFYRTISLLRPRIVVVENVPGLRKRGFDRVLGDLAEGGYNARWFSLRSSDIGAPHKRERVFIIANTTIGREHETNEDNERIQFISSEDITSSDTDEKYDYRELERGERGRPEFAVGLAPYTSGTGTWGNTGTILRKEEQGWSEEDGINSFEPCSALTSNPSVQGLQRTKSKERSDVFAGSVDADAYSRRFEGVREQDSIRKNKRGDNADRFASPHQDWGKYEDAIRRWELIFESVPPPLTEGERLNPNFVEWMMGYPQDWTDGVSRSQRLKMLGNSVQVQCAYEVATIVKSLAEFS